VAASWGLDESASITFQLPAADIRNGELRGTRVSWSIPYTPITTATGTFSDTGTARVDDTWRISIPALQVDAPFYAFFSKSQPPCAPPCEDDGKTFAYLNSFVNRIGERGPFKLTGRLGARAGPTCNLPVGAR
jgi:hypothetical protein